MHTFFSLYFSGIPRALNDVHHNNDLANENNNQNTKLT